MKRIIISLAAAVLAVLAVAPVAQAARPQAWVQGPIVSHGDVAEITIKYACRESNHLWVSAKQAAAPRTTPDALKQEGSGAIAAAWLHSHRNPFTCDGTVRTQTFEIDTVEWGQGPLKAGQAFVQFCLTTPDMDLEVNKRVFARVVEAPAPTV